LKGGKNIMKIFSDLFSGGEKNNDKPKENKCPKCGESPVSFRPNYAKKLTNYKCKNGHDWNAK
jgi:predicted RNA-binding Zn-ribbon protein involved in translation (DUF1610 family)